MVRRTRLRWRTKGAPTEDLNRKRPTGNRENRWSMAKPELKTTLGSNRAKSPTGTDTGRVSSQINSWEGLSGSGNTPHCRPNVLTPKISWPRPSITDEQISGRCTAMAGNKERAPLGRTVGTKNRAWARRPEPHTQQLQCPGTESIWDCSSHAAAWLLVSYRCSSRCGRGGRVWAGDTAVTVTPHFHQMQCHRD